MIRINLLPVRQLKQRALALRQIFAVMAGFLLFLGVLGIVVSIQTGKVNSLNGDINSLNAQIRKYNKPLAQIKEIEKTMKELKRKTEVIDKLKTDSSLTVRVLDDVANRVDNERLWLLSLNQQGGSLQLSGVALDNQTVAQFMDSLKASRYVKSVDLTNSSLKKIAGRDLKSFSLRCSVAQPKPKTEEKQLAKAKK